ncbi:hypothetical protein K438DRAFT_1834254 [Mycena galopus ATCC 62051]|nr:hypothetical protein K438DRAFT_1834254 [Mycena galopus ATCC 62051]
MRIPTKTQEAKPRHGRLGLRAAKDEGRGTAHVQDPNDRMNKNKKKGTHPRTANSAPLPPASNTNAQTHIQSCAAPRTHLPACPRRTCCPAARCAHAARMPICRNHEQIVSTARWKVRYT